VLGFVAVGLGLSHHPRRAVVAVVLAVVIVVSPRARTLLDRSARWVTPVAATGLGWVLLAPVYYLVVTPLGALLRVCGSSPLDIGLDRRRSSYWSTRSARSGTRPERLFADERGWHPVGFSPSQRRRLVLRSVVAILLIEVLVAGGLFMIERRRSAPPEAGGVSVASSDRPAALAGPEWMGDALTEQARMTSELVATPYTGASLRDFEGRYFNVANRVRASYRSPLAATREPVEVWFFGGSTTFGFDLQRDGHTIPSEFVRLAEAQGIAVEARNYGVAGYLNYQETVLLSLLVTAVEPPDLAVFYDGTNDTATGLLDTFGGLNPAGEPGEIGALQQRRAFDLGADVPASTDGPPSPLAARPARKPATVAGIVDDIVGVYGQGVDLSRALGERYGFEVAHFWQPDLYSKRPLDPAESELLSELALDPFRYETMVELSARVRQGLPSGVIELSGALDRLSGPVLTDFVHTNERGARAVAEAMFGHLAPDVRRLGAGR
jgi:lysophospholipase L1-like esterase